MYKNNFIVAVKCGGRILREVGDLVSLPFGSEYSLLLKNKFARPAVIKVEIDGQDVLNDNKLVIYPNGETELKGFMVDNIVRNRFKFIKKTTEIVRHRGDKLDDSFIRVEFQYEKAIRETIHEIIHHRHVYHDPPYFWHHPRSPWFYQGDYVYSNGTVNRDDFNSLTTNSVYCSSGACGSSYKGAGMGDVTLTNSAGLSMPEIKEDEGITVKGSEAYQAFNPVQTEELEANTEVIILKLKGTTNGNTIKEAITVHSVRICETCGRSSKPLDKFCGNCGTALMV